MAWSGSSPNWVPSGGRPRGVGRVLAKGLLIHPQQADQAVAGQNVKVDVGQRLQVVHSAGGGYQRQKQAQPGDLHRLGHNIHPVQVLGDDTLFDEVIQAGVIGSGFVQPLLQIAIFQKLNPTDDALVNIHQRFQRRHQKRARAGGRVQQAQAGQNIKQQRFGVGRVQFGVDIANGGKGGWRRQAGQGLAHLGQPVKDQFVDGLLAQIFGDFGPGIVGSKLLLVDVLFKDVAQHIGIDLVIAPAHAVVQAPGVTAKQAI